MTTKKATALPAVGRWEWVALPEHGIACLKARVDPAQESSSLCAVDLEIEQVDGEDYLQFKVYPLADDPLTFVVVEARREPGGAVLHHVGQGPHPVIVTELTIGNESFPATLEIIEARPGPWPLTLGRNVIGRFAVDPDREALAGPPKLAWKPRSRPRTQRSPENNRRHRVSDSDRETRRPSGSKRKRSDRR